MTTFSSTFAVLISAAILIAVPLGMVSPQAEFTVTLQRAEDRAEVIRSGNLATVRITSPRGIGRATLRRTSRNWPRRLSIQLELKGLEQLIVSDGTHTLGGSVSSGPERTVRVWRVPDESQNLDPGDPWALSLKPVFNDDLATQPNRFLIELPEALLRENSAEMRVEWIDYFR